MPKARGAWRGPRICRGKIANQKFICWSSRNLRQSEESTMERASACSSNTIEHHAFFYIYVRPLKAGQIDIYSRGHLESNRSWKWQVMLDQVLERAHMTMLNGWFSLSMDIYECSTAMFSSHWHLPIWHFPINHAWLFYHSFHPA